MLKHEKIVSRNVSHKKNAHIYSYDNDNDNDSNNDKNCQKCKENDSVSHAEILKNYIP